MKNKIYISGKITGDEIAAFERFQEMEHFFLNLGHEVVNPMKLPHNHSKEWLSYMREDIIALVGCDSICMLPDWNDSKGAIVEHELAKGLGFTVMYANQCGSCGTLIQDVNDCQLCIPCGFELAGHTNI